jgi:4-aminobutyrate aminotransferase/4-aminobutyrate aminotransferase/(S)-3-amino-2-methylpropionate transaminase
MIAVEFHDPKTKAPSPEFTKLVQAEAQKNGLLLLTCGVYGNVIRFLFPLTIGDTVLDEGLAIFTTALQTASQAMK